MNSLIQSDHIKHHNHVLSIVLLAHFVGTCCESEWKIICFNLKLLLRKVNYLQKEFSTIEILLNGKFHLRLSNRKTHFWIYFPALNHNVIILKSWLKRVLFSSTGLLKFSFNRLSFKSWIKRVLFSSTFVFSSSAFRWISHLFLWLTILWH
jgi:hypothetical protein